MTRWVVTTAVTGLMLCGAAGAAPRTYWRAEPGETGDWFWPANWSHGVPREGSLAFIANGGTAAILGDHAAARSLYLGWLCSSDPAAVPGSGAVLQIGGIAEFRSFLALGTLRRTRGEYDLIGGQLSAGNTAVGGLGVGEFHQAGGIHEVRRTLSIGLGRAWLDWVREEDVPARPSDWVLQPRSAYEMTGGELVAGSVSVGGCGSFVQIGGVSRIHSQLRIGEQPWLSALSAAEPYRATYELIGGELATRETVVGAAGVGTFRQAGGVHLIDGALRVGGRANAWLEPVEVEAEPLAATDRLIDNDLLAPADRPQPRRSQSDVVRPGLGRYVLAAGTLSTRTTHVGGTGTGRFLQSGGTHDVAGLFRVGGANPRPQSDALTATNAGVSARLAPVPVTGSGRYDLRNGALSAESAEIGVVGRGHVLQAGGTFHVDRLLTVGGGLWPGDSQGTYELRGGALSARQQKIDTTGTMRQMGGTNDVVLLTIGWDGRYEYLGGELNVAAGLDLWGELDFGGAPVTLEAQAGLLSFPHGEILNGRRATLIGGPRSLIIFDEDFDPHAELGHFESEGIVHFAGSDLALTTDEGFVGWGAVDDFVHTKGQIVAWPGGGIDLRTGVHVWEGEVHLGSGQLSVRDDRSGMWSGRLTAASMAMGNLRQPDGEPLDGETTRVSPTRYAQSGGSTEIVGELTVSHGVYELIDGELSAGRAQLGTQWGWERASVVQTGGSARIAGTLGIGLPQSNALAEVSAEDLAPVEPAPQPGPAPDPAPDPTPICLPEASYYLRNGRLAAGSVEIGTGRGSARFVQTGGALRVDGRMTVGGAGNGSYVISNGALSAASIGVGSWSGQRRRGTLGVFGPDADVEVRNRLAFGPGSTMLTSAGAAIRMTGPTPDPTGVCPRPTFDIRLTNESAMAGMNDLALIFEGGDNCPARMEIGGEDMGHGLAGYERNFALETLQVGGEADVGWLVLVDLYDNQPDAPGPDVLYTEVLIVGAGSVLDLNGLDIYYQHLYLDPDGEIIDGGGNLFGPGNDGGSLFGPGNGGDGPVAIPEPSATALLALGAIALLRRRRRAWPAPVCARAAAPPRSEE